MSSLEKISIRIETELAEKIKSNAQGTSISDFIRNAIKNELNKNENELNESIKIIKNLESFNLQKIENKLSEIELKLQLIIDKDRKQDEILNQHTEILKLMHRRISLNATYGRRLLDNVKSDQDVEQMFNKTTAMVKHEIDNIFKENSDE